MQASERPLIATVLAGLLMLAALATAYVGMMALGYLVPAVGLAIVAALVWLGRGHRVILAIAMVALFSELTMDLVIDFGDGLGHRKLDISAMALLVNIAFGGPMMTFLAVPLLASYWWSAALRDWIGGREARA